MRHLVLIGALFPLAPALNRASNWLAVWREIAVAASINSLVLIGHFPQWYVSPIGLLRVQYVPASPSPYVGTITPTPNEFRCYGLAGR
jgi:hypothetical protein